MANDEALALERTAADTSILHQPPVPFDQLTPQVAAVEGDQQEELGGTGLRGAEPFNGWLWEEFITQLRGLAGARVYREMADNDPMCGAVLYAVEMLMKNVTWRVEPKEQTPEAEVWAERIEAMLFRDMAHPFGNYVDEATSMLVYGYSPHEIVWKVCRGETDNEMSSSEFTDNMLVPAALPVRSQDTVWRWFFDTRGHGNITGMEQFRLGMVNAIIPINKMLLNRTQVRRNNPEGRSILRSAYVPWLRKKTIEEAEGRLALRSAGIVEMRVPEKLMDTQTGTKERALYNAYKVLADSLAQDRTGSVVLPSTKDEKGNFHYTMDYKVADSRQVKDFSPIVDRYDARIAVSMLADFLLLGTKNVGSYALADSKTSLFVLSTEGYLGNIAEQLNRVLLKKVARLNGIPANAVPVLKPGTVQKPDLERIGAFFQQLTSAGAAILPDRNIEQWLLSQVGAPTQQTEG